MTRLGRGPVKGYVLHPGPRDEREQTLRGAFLQALLHEAAGDYRKLFALLTHRGDGRLTIAEKIAMALLELQEELAETYEASVDFVSSQAAADGYVYMLPTIEQDVADEEIRLKGRAERVTDECDMKAFAWSTGEVLAFERHPLCTLLWKDVTQRELKNVPTNLTEPPLITTPAELIERVEGELREDLKAHAPKAEEEEGKGEPPGEVRSHLSTRDLLDGLPAELIAYRQYKSWTLGDTMEPCCVCGLFLVPRNKCWRSGNPGSSFATYAHDNCLRKRVLKLSDQITKARQAEDRAKELSREEQLALGAEAGKPFRARHKSDEDPACEICLKAIEKGSMARRKSPTSSKRLHDTCVLEWLEKAKQPLGVSE